MVRIQLERAASQAELGPASPRLGPRRAAVGCGPRGLAAPLAQWWRRLFSEGSVRGPGCCRRGRGTLTLTGTAAPCGGGGTAPMPERASELPGSVGFAAALGCSIALAQANCGAMRCRRIDRWRPPPGSLFGRTRFARARPRLMLSNAAALSRRRQMSMPDLMARVLRGTLLRLARQWRRSAPREVEVRSW